MGLRSCCSVVVLVFFLGTIKTSSPWAFLTDLPGCSREPLPGNVTGLKVALGPIGKSGTKTLAYFLTELGVRTYHSADLTYFAFEEFLTKERERRGAWQSMGQITWSMTPESGDLQAPVISKCRPQGIAFDGTAGIYPSVVEHSPGVKAIILERPFHVWSASRLSFMLPHVGATLHDFLMCASLNSLFPWGFFVRLIDPLVGSPAAKTLQDGFPLVSDTMPPMTFIHFQMVNHRRLFPIWMVSPLSVFLPQGEEDYNSFFAKTKKALPRERTLEFDFKKHRAEDVCEFLEISPCPRSGKIPRMPNSFWVEQDNPISGAVALTVGLFYYWVNWRFLCWIWGLCWRCPKSDGLADKKGK